MTPLSSTIRVPVILLIIEKDLALKVRGPGSLVILTSRHAMGRTRHNQGASPIQEVGGDRVARDLAAEPSLQHPRSLPCSVDPSPKPESAASQCSIRRRRWHKARPPPSTPLSCRGPIASPFVFREAVGRSGGGESSSELVPWGASGWRRGSHSFTRDCRHHPHDRQRDEGRACGDCRADSDAPVTTRSPPHRALASITSRTRYLHFLRDRGDTWSWPLVAGALALLLSSGSLVRVQHGPFVTPRSREAASALDRRLPASEVVSRGVCYHFAPGAHRRVYRRRQYRHRQPLAVTCP